MTVPMVIPCLQRNCVHYRGVLGPPDDPVFICMAYPLGIPQDILVGEDLHTSSRGDDDGIVYEAVANNLVFKQLPIDDRSKAALIKIRINIFYRDVDALCERMYTGQISLGQWEEEMRTLIKELHTGCAVIGKGGWDRMSHADWGHTGPLIKKQYQWLHGFAEAIDEQRDTISLAAIKARAHLYGQAGGHTANYTQAGSDIRSQLPWIPRDGSTECLNGCKCSWTLTPLGVEDGYQLVQAVWTLHPAEHCVDCIARSGHTEVIKVPAGVEVPDFIGGL